MRARPAVLDRTRCPRRGASGGIFSFRVLTSHPLQSAHSRGRAVCHYTPWYRSAIRMHRQDAAARGLGDVGRGTARIPQRDDALCGSVPERPYGGLRRGRFPPPLRGVLPPPPPPPPPKSTLLNIGSGLYTPSAGEAFVDGERVEGPNAHVAFMLQKDLLLPWRTVFENVMFGVEIQRLALPERKRRAHALLENLNLAEFA